MDRNFSAGNVPPRAVLYLASEPIWLVPQQTLRAVVAIPARDEAERVAACLEALAGQTGAPHFGVLLFVNNATDDTAAIARARAWPFALRVVERVLPPERAHAGWARRLALEAAADWLDGTGAPGGVLLTTDADSRVGPDWIARNLAGIASGADLVAGRLSLDESDAARLPPALHARGRLEGIYEALLLEIAARIDPVPGDPWPNHDTHSGASLAVRLDAYRALGGSPTPPVGEDRALVAALVARDARVRHDPGIVVVTSGRLDGRAPGGAADTIRVRCTDLDAPCDDRLEHASRAMRRARWRRHLRGLFAGGRLMEDRLWAPALGLGSSEASAIAALPTFGAVWAAVEGGSPRLAFHPLLPRQLPGEIARARRALKILQADGQSTRSTSIRYWSDRDAVSTRAKSRTSRMSRSAASSPESG